MTPGAVTIRGKRLSRLKRVREVDYVHSEFDVELTPERLAFYREAKARHGDFAFAIDRQSIAAVLTDREATGQWGRVTAIHGLAEQPPAGLERLWLPRAVLNRERHLGEFMFHM